MIISKQDIEHIAKLSNLAISATEAKTLTDQLDDIFNNAQKLNNLDTKNINPTAHAIPQSTVFRNDIIIDSDQSELLLQNAPDSEDNFFAVPKM